MKTRLLYAASVLTYVAITFVTKRLLTWNLGMLYFVVTLDLLPRAYRRLRGGPGTTPVRL